METLGGILIFASIGTFLCACIGLINPRWMRLPSRIHAVGVWVLSVMLLAAGGSLLPDPDLAPEDIATAEAPSPPAQKALSDVVWTEDGQMASLDLLTVERHESGSWTALEGQVKNVRGPLGRFMVTVAWFTADGQFLDAETAGIASPRLAPGEVSKFFVAVAGEMPETAYFTLTFRFRGAPHGDRLLFRGARPAPSPALFEVGPEGVMACDSRESLEAVLSHALAGREIQMRSLMFRLVDERSCKMLDPGALIDVLGVREGGLARVRRVEEYGYGGRRGSPLYWTSSDALNASR